MIQTNKTSDTISGYFGLTPERYAEIEKQFEAIRDIQKDRVLKDLMESVDKDGLDKIGFRRVPVINAYMEVAKNDNEQVYCAFRVAHEVDFFTDVMNKAIRSALVSTIIK